MRQGVTTGAAASVATLMQTKKVNCESMKERVKESIGVGGEASRVDSVFMYIE